MNSLVQFSKRFHAVMSVVYLLGAIFFYFFSDLLLELINIVPATLGVGQPIAASSEHFWLSFSVSMMMMLSLISYQTFRAVHVETQRALMSVHALSKLISSLGLAVFGLQTSVFAYWSGVITDFPLFLIVSWLWVRLGQVAQNSK
jgi:hypothetical protein